MANVQLAFGRRGPQILHISQVESGLACRCQCLGCEDDLVAKKGPDTAHHFAHHVEVNCRFTPESALHIYAKQLIASRPTFRTPEVGDLPEGVVYVTESWLERAICEVVPDVQLATETGWLLAEVAVTNSADDRKREKLRRLQVPAVEIDLANIPRDAALEIIDFAVLEDIERRSWLYHPHLEEVEKQRAAQEKSDWAKSEFHVRAADEKALARAHEEFLANQDQSGLRLIEQATRVDAAELDRMLRATPPSDRTRLYSLFEPAEKLAYHCHLLGRSAKRLPYSWNELPYNQNPFVEPPIVWRTGILLKFAASWRPFSVGDVMDWCAERYPMLEFAHDPAAGGYGVEWDVSEMSEIELTVFQFLDHLERQLYIESDGWRPKNRHYKPTGRFKTTDRRK